MNLVLKTMVDRVLNDCAFIFLIVASVILVSCDRDHRIDGGLVVRSGLDTISETEMIENAVKELKECPAWAGIDVSDESEVMLIMACLQRFDQFNTVTLRKVVEEFVGMCERDKLYSVDEMSKIFVLLRYVFDVPSISSTREAKFFGGWVGIPEEENEINLMWPLEFRGCRDLRLTGEFVGFLGDDYQALEEFDYFHERFGRRRIGN